ncbi:MAG TPA: cob(I)yrinic acid a,c-diamide adenosyltransferase, partial [Candidatus Goldiibacteriota bacterium]|nr:cob(I)yrinic acid a,c-diamide adenosyltransferase [Candidatus Goldiibacteriota bacterium]
MKKGMVQIYTGDGKGKTTAAVGAAIRACGAGMKVLFCQFLKNGKTASGEEEVLKKQKNIRFIKYDEMSPFFERNIDMEELKEAVKDDLLNAFKEINSGKYDVAVLDEAVHLINLELITEKELISMIDSRPAGVEIILTGRGAG